MTAEEFIKTSAKRGYCNKETAKKYMKKVNKDLYSEEDLEEVYRLQERLNSNISEDHRTWTPNGFAKTSKRYDYGM